MTELELLRAARERLSDPNNWWKAGGEGPNGERCVALTILDIAAPNWRSMQPRGWAHKILHVLQRILGLSTVGLVSLFRWNDDPETSHADLMDLLDRAIAYKEAELSERGPVEEIIGAEHIVEAPDAAPACI